MLGAKNALLLDENPMYARPESELIVDAMMADSIPFKRCADVVRFTPNDPMRSGEVAAKAAEIFSGVQPKGGTAQLSEVAQG